MDLLILRPLIIGFCYGYIAAVGVSIRYYGRPHLVHNLSYATLLGSILALTEAVLNHLL
jgi:hypothetical protein